MCAEPPGSSGIPFPQALWLRTPGPRLYTNEVRSLGQVIRPHSALTSSTPRPSGPQGFQVRDVLPAGTAHIWRTGSCSECHILRVTRASLGRVVRR